MDNFSNNLSYLLVSEAIRELEKRYDGMNDKDLHIETQRSKLFLVLMPHKFYGWCIRWCTFTFRL